MNKNSQILLVSALTCVALLMSGFVYAESDSSKNALAKAQYMMRQISNQKAELEKQLAGKKVEVEALTKEVAKLKNETKAKTEANIAQQQEALTMVRSDRQKMQETLKTETEQTRKLTDENEIFSKKLAAQTNNFDLCYSNNKKLYEVNKEILGKYQDKGFWAALSQKEPFTTIEKVKVENLVQDYQYQIDTLSVKIISDDKPL